MFLKLLKYKFNTHRNLFIILSAIALSLGAIGALDMWFMQSHIAYIESDVISVFASLFCSVLLMVIWYSLIAYSIAVAILLMLQFYKSHFSDEGYLTFTLPITTHQHLLSSYVNNLIWTVITMLVMLVSILIFVSPIYAMNDFRDFMFDIYLPYTGTLVPSLIIMSLASLVSGCMIPMLAISIGCVVVKKGKLFASFGIYYGINVVVSALTGIMSVLALVGDFAIWDNANSDTFRLLLTVLAPTLIYIGVSIGGYFLMHHLVDKKLNLP